LRANLSLLENISIGMQYRRNLSNEVAINLTSCLLEKMMMIRSANKRVEKLTHSEIFVGKFFRAATTNVENIIIDRPALLLPDVRYSDFLIFMANTLAAEPRCEVLKKLPKCTVIDYEWNKSIWDNLEIQNV